MVLLRRPSTATVAAAAVLLLAGCASGGAGHGGHAAAESRHDPVDGAPAVTIDAVDIDYEPATLELTAGEAINLSVANSGTTLHDFTLEAADVHLNVGPGATEVTSLTIDEPGTYRAVCTVAGHEAAGMTVDVVVTAA